MKASIAEPIVKPPVSIAQHRYAASITKTKEMQMRIKLYKLEVERPDAPIASYVVALSEKQATGMVIDHDLDLG